MLTSLTDLILNLKFVLLLLFVLNFGSLFLFKEPYRFIKGPLIIFSFILATFLVYRLAIYPSLEKNNREARQAEIKRLGWEYINHPDKDAEFIKQSDRNRITYFALFRIAGIQAAFSFILAITGFFLTPEKKLYALYALGFLVVTVIFFI